MHNIQISLSKYRAAIFDMDGTMIDNMNYHQKAWQMLLSEHDVKVTEAEFKYRFSGKKNEEILEAIFEHKLSEKNLVEYAKRKETLYRGLYESNVKEVDGLKNLVEILLQNKLKLAVATGAPKESRDFVLKKLGLNEPFKTILGSEHTKYGKPHPEIYLSIAKKLGVIPKECIVFEDSPSGVTSGKDAGMTVVGILTSHTQKELEKADFIVNDFAHIKLI